MIKLVFYLSLFFIAFITSCDSSPSVPELIDQEVEKKLLDFKERKIKECKKKVLEEAEHFVDSIMYLKINRGMDGAGPLPERPERPEDSIGYEYNIDTTLESEIWVDTLLDSIILDNPIIQDSINND